LDVETDIVRVVDHRISFGVTSDEGEGHGEDHPLHQADDSLEGANAVHVARTLKASPIPAAGNKFEEDTEHMPHVG
jgi:hypothetical protein